MKKTLNIRGFTLLELLIVIGILATLTTVVVLTINPAEYLKQARDTKRVVDLSNINKAVQLFDFDNAGIISTTSSTIVYVSIPDTSSTCGNLGLPTLPSGYTYHCVTSDYLNKINGTGWIPLDLTKISGGSPLSSLPIDPINTTSTRNYYTYMQGGSFELAASFESASYKQGGEKDKTSTDKGTYTDLYEVGTNTALLPIDYGDSSLALYWNFENNVNDSSGNRNNGAWYGTSTSRYATGKVGTSAGYFNGGNDFVGLTTGGNYTSEWSAAAWVKVGSASSQNLIQFAANTLAAKINHTGDKALLYLNDGINDHYRYSSNPLGIQDNNWHHLAFVFKQGSSPANDLIKVYFDGVDKTGIGPNNGPTLNFSSTWWIGKLTNGNIDDLRVYSRVLSASEISALYNATK